MKYAIFDFDGTLFDSAGVWKDLDLEYLSRFDIVPKDEVREKIITMSLYDSVRFIIETYNLDNDIDDAMSSLYEVIGKRYENKVEPKLGVEHFLIELKKRNIKMCVATLSSRNHVIKALEHFNMFKYFEFVIGAEDINTSKTSPDIFYMALERLNANICETCVFEDSLFALETAKNEGFKVIGVYDECSKDNCNKIKEISDFFIDDYSNINIEELNI